MNKLRTGVVAALSVSVLQVGACTFGPSDAAFSTTDAGPHPSNGGNDATGGAQSTGGRGTGGRRNTGGTGVSGAGGSDTGGAPNGGAGGGSPTGGASSGGASGSTGGVQAVTGGAANGGTSGSGGVSSGGAGGDLADASAGGADAGGDGSTEGGGSCGSCPKGQYCDPSALVCKPGCGNAAACASGSCATTHDCDRCVSDLECAEGRVCSTGKCLAPCVNSTDCPNGYTCCNDRCADTSRDHDHCASCTSVCGASDYCSAAGAGCKQTSISTVCDTPHVTLLLDGASTDEALAPIVANALTSGCGTAHVTVTESETASSAVNTTTGQPVAGAQDLIVEIGSPYSQKVGRYIEDAGFSRAYDLGDGSKAGFYGRAADGGADPEIIVIPVPSFSEAHDLFKIELVLDPISGTRILQIYGIFAPGTLAAEWFFENRMLPNLSAYPLRYYVYEWTHGDAGTNPGNNDTFRLVASGN